MTVISVTLSANYDRKDSNVWLRRRVLEIDQNLKSRLLRLRPLISRHRGFDVDSVGVQVVETWMVAKKF